MSLGLCVGMSQKKAKLLRKIAKLSGRTDDYIKKEYKKMSPDLQRGYLAFMKENIRRIQAEKSTPPTETIITDIPERKEG